MACRSKNMKLTTAPITVGDTSDSLPEFGRTSDVARLFGLKRGIIYALYREGRIRSALVRPRGSGKGVRLWGLHSIRDLVRSQVVEYSVADAANEGGAES
jgi:hypothetical protein